MYEVTSQTISEQYKADNVPPKEWEFRLLTGNTGKLTISDPLLDSRERAEERAKSEFLKNSYKLNTVTVKTYRTDIKLNDILRVRGLPYLVKDIQTVITDRSIVNSIRMVRYEV